MNVQINKEECIGCGLCAETCPEVFRLTDEGHAEVYADPSPETEGSVREAADSCPVSVIEVEE